MRRDPLHGPTAIVKTKRGLVPPSGSFPQRAIGIGRHSLPYSERWEAFPVPHEPRHCAANGTEPCTHTHAEASR